MIKKAIFPRCYLQGKDILKNFGGMPELENKNLFILATNSAVNSIIPENISSWKKNCRIEYEKFNGKCTWEEINRVLKIAKSNNYDFIMGLGGGKTIDTARVVANQLNIRYIAAPTIAATDAPTASACVVYDNDGAIVAQ